MTKPDIEKRRAVTNSRAFRTWLAARNETEPTPSDPYRAYMIDLSLDAKISEKRPWKKEPNRLDLIDVDFPYSNAPNWRNRPARKPKQRHREAPEKSPTLPKDAASRELTLAAEQMAIHYGQPAPTVRVSRGKGALSSYARTGVGALQGGNLIRVGGGMIDIGVKGSKLSPQAKAAAFHEVGHVVHAQKSFKHETLLAGVKPFGAGLGGSKTKYADEQAAWKFADPFIAAMPTKHAQPVARWTKAFALHTYRRGAERRGTKLKINKKGEIV